MSDELKSIIRTLIGIESLEYENKNLLSGDNKSRCELKIELLNRAFGIVSNK